jgi:nickel transport protein
MFTTPALAHRVLVFAYVAGDTIHTESKFVPNTPVRQGEIRVLEQKTNQVLLTGKTDAHGKFSFKIPAPAAAQRMDLKIVVAADQGHQGEWLLKAAGYLPGLKTAAGATPAPSSPGASPPLPVATETKPGAMDAKLLEETVNQALERQLAPINQKLAEMTVHRTSLTDIIGGLGYILGFFGIWAYLQSKRKKKS